MSVVAAPSGIRDRIRSTTDLSDTTNRDRIAMARAGGRMVRDFPVFGLGPEMVKRYSRHRAGACLTCTTT